MLRSREDLRLKQENYKRSIMAIRPETTKHLSALVEKDLLGNGDTRIYWAKEVTFDYATDHAVRVDYMRFDPVNNTAGGIERGDFYCYEVKSSVEDFRSGHGRQLPKAKALGLVALARKS